MLPRPIGGPPSVPSFNSRVQEGTRALDSFYGKSVDVGGVLLPRPLCTPQKAPTKAVGALRSEALLGRGGGSEEPLRSSAESTPRLPASQPAAARAHSRHVYL